MSEECYECKIQLDKNIEYTNIPHTDLYYCDSCLYSDKINDCEYGKVSECECNHCIHCYINQLPHYEKIQFFDVFLPELMNEKGLSQEFLDSHKKYQQWKQLKEAQ